MLTLEYICRMIKSIKVLNLFSTLLFGIILLLVYAYLPISVDVNIEGVSTVHKQTFFYVALSSFLVINVLLRLITRFGFTKFNETLKGWVSLVVLVVNVYLTLLVGFIGVWNNATSISPDGYGYLNYIGPFLLVCWIIGLIFLVFKNILKPTH